MLSLQIVLSGVYPVLRLACRTMTVQAWTTIPTFNEAGSCGSPFKRQGVIGRAGAGTADENVPPSANMTACFAETAGAGVCRGAYAPALLREWHAWDAAHGSENEAVDCFGADQLYVVFVVADGGADLEHFQLRSFEEARSVLLQARRRCL